MHRTDRDLLRRGYAQDTLDLARAQQVAEKQSGKARSLEQILQGKRFRPEPSSPAADLTSRQLRRRGRYGQAALLADQEALGEKDLLRASQARAAANMLKALSAAPRQMEFEFFMSNVSIGQQFFDAIFDRLKQSGATGAEQRTALVTLQLVARWIGWQTHECSKSAADLARLLDMDRGNMTRTLNLLERLGAITRIKRGRTKVIAITPEGVFRGDINQHADTVERYKAEVVPLRRDPFAPKVSDPA